MLAPTVRAKNPGGFGNSCTRSSTPFIGKHSQEGPAPPSPCCLRNHLATENKAAASMHKNPNRGRPLAIALPPAGSTVSEPLGYESVPGRSDEAQASLIFESWYAHTAMFVQSTVFNVIGRARRDWLLEDVAHLNNLLVAVALTISLMAVPVKCSSSPAPRATCADPNPRKSMKHDMRR